MQSFAVLLLSGWLELEWVLSRLSPAWPSQQDVLDTSSMGGRQLHAKHALGRVLPAYPPQLKLT